MGRGRLNNALWAPLLGRQHQQPITIPPSAAAERPDEVKSPWNWLFTRNRLLDLEKHGGLQLYWMGGYRGRL